MGVLQFATFYNESQNETAVHRAQTVHATHYLRMNYYVQKMGGLHLNGIQLKSIIGTHGN